MDGIRPVMSAALILPQHAYAEFRIKAQEALFRSKIVIKDTMAQFQKQFGRGYGNGLVVPYKCEDADVLMISYGGLAVQMEDAIDKARELGYKAGALRLRTYRPFPTEDILEYIKKFQVVGVFDRAVAFGSPAGGAVSSDIKAVCQGDAKARQATIVPFVGGLGGRDVTLDEQVEQIKILIELKEKGELPARKHKMWGTYWTGLITGQMNEIPEEEFFGDI